MNNITLIALLGLALRFIFAVFGEFSTDAEAIYLSALKFYQTGVPGTVGARVVYSGTSIPGSLLDLMTGIPLFISRGALWGFAFAGVVYSWVSAIIIFRTFRSLSIKTPEWLLAAFVFLSPWPILFSDALNSSLMLFPSAIWFYSVTKIFAGSKKKKNYLLLGLSLSLGFQLHLSFVILMFGVFALLVLDEKSRQKKPISQIILGSLLGGITLIPYIIDRAKNSVTHVDQIGSNVVFNLEKFGDLFKMLGRYLTFPTAEITRFMGTGRGFQQALETIRDHSWLSPVFIVAMTVSAFIIVMTLHSFYLKKPESRLDLWVILVPLVTGVMFLFSIKGPSAHTFWALFPISIYPIAMRWDRFPKLLRRKSIIGIYFFSSITLMLGGVLPHVSRPYVGSMSFGVSTASAAYGEKKLRVFLPQDVVTLDWNQTASTADFPVILNLQEGLIEIDEAGKVHPHIAQSWRVSKDGKKFNFTLNKNVLWSDGKPLSADDFVASWKRAMNPANGFSTSYMFTDIEEVTALSASELEVKLKTQNFNWYLRTASPNFFPIRQSLVTKGASVWTKPGAMVTLGPFTLAEHNANQSFVLNRNPTYFSIRPQYEKLEFVIGALEEGLSLLKKDKVDMVFHAPVGSLEQLPKNLLISYHAPQLTKRLEFNFAKYPTGLQKFRLAIAQAIPREALAKEMGKRFVKAGSYVPVGFKGYDAKGGLEYDPSAAKKSIREMFSLNTVTLDVLVPCFDAAREDNIKIAQFLQRELKKSIGVELKLKLEPDQKRYALMRDTKDWHILIRDFSGSFFDPAYYYEPYGTGARYGMKWKSTTYDDAVMFAKSAATEKERESWFKKADEALTRTEVVLVPLVYQKAISILGPRVSKIKKKYYEPFILKSVELK